MRDVHPWLDAVALAWPVLALAALTALAAWAIRARRIEPVLSGASLLVAGCVVIVGPWIPYGREQVRRPLTIVAANVLGGEDRIGVLAASLVDRDADVLVVSEVAPELDEALRHRFPFARFRYDVGVYSKHPLGPAGRAPGGQRGMRVRVRAPGETVLLYAEHVRKPGLRTSTVESGFRTHRRTVEAIADSVARESSPTLLVGDLNLVDRSGAYRRLTRVLDDAMRADWSGPTAVRRQLRPLLARVDHILIPSGWCSAQSSLFDIPGSDHRGVTAVVGPCTR